jgi:hypothetical protein
MKDDELKPVAWLHTLHMEGGQSYDMLSDSDGRDCDEPERTAFGKPGRDYSEEYKVTSMPLYTSARIEALTAEVERKDAALRKLVDHCWEQERIITENIYHMDFCGESAVLCEARAAQQPQEKVG